MFHVEHEHLFDLRPFWSGIDWKASRNARGIFMQIFNNFSRVQFLIGRVACARARVRARRGRGRACGSRASACANRVRNTRDPWGFWDFLRVHFLSFACVYGACVYDANRVSDVCA